MSMMIAAAAAVTRPRERSHSVQRIEASDHPADTPQRAPTAIAYLRHAGVGLGLIALLLTRDNDGSAIYDPANRWLIAAGLAIIPYAVWLARFEDSARPANWPLAPRVVALAWLSLALYGIAEGMSYKHEGSPWLLLELPMALTATALAAWFAFAPRARTFELRWLAAAGCAILAAAGFQTAAAIL